MLDRREFEGIGYHYFDDITDCLLVDRWLKRPEDLKGQSVPFSKLLPLDLRCTDVYKGQNLRARRKFKFRIIIEVERNL